MTARFILSFDCEGKWGVADRLDTTIHRQLCDENLRITYRNILELLDEYEIPATFAFVGCFSLSVYDLLHRVLPSLDFLASHFDGYLGKVIEDCLRGSRQGWVGDWALDAVASASVAHEVGLHGVTHIPWDYPGMSEEFARMELGSAYDMSFPIVERVSTYIYPRNAVAYPHLLAERGILAYRAARPRTTRIQSLFSEFNVFSVPDSDPDLLVAPLPIPAGFFVNWQSGARKLVPVSVSGLRARTMLRRAIQTARVVHYWTHPENFASAHGTIKVLRTIVQEVAAVRDRGECEILTQDAYFRSVGLPTGRVGAVSTRHAP